MDPGQERIVVIEKNKHPCLTFIGGAVMVLFIAGVVGNWLDGQKQKESPTPPPPRPSARFEITDSLNDEGCTHLAEYCVQVHCSYQNNGDGAGEETVGADLFDEAGTLVAARSQSLTLMPGRVQRVTFSFPEAELEAKYRYRCRIGSR